MSVQGLNLNISDNNRRIAQLEQECDDLTKATDRLCLERERFACFRGRFERHISLEYDRAFSIKSVENMRIAQRCGEKLTAALSGEKCLLANESFAKIDEVIGCHIDENEDQIHKKRIEIRRLKEENSFFKQSIYRLQEEERRNEARRNVLL